MALKPLSCEGLLGPRRVDLCASAAVPAGTPIPATCFPGTMLAQPDLTSGVSLIRAENASYIALSSGG
jgi:hypothetical protein